MQERLCDFVGAVTRVARCMLTAGQAYPVWSVIRGRRSALEPSVNTLKVVSSLPLAFLEHNGHPRESTLRILYDNTALARIRRHAKAPAHARA